MVHRTSLEMNEGGLIGCRRELGTWGELDGPSQEEMGLDAPFPGETSGERGI
jgi:hypothetical protein